MLKFILPLLIGLINMIVGFVIYVRDAINIFSPPT